MNIIEIQDDLLERMKLAEGDIVIVRNFTRSLDASLSSVYKNISQLEQRIVELEKLLVPQEEVPQEISEETPQE